MIFLGRYLKPTYGGNGSERAIYKLWLNVKNNVQASMVTRLLLAIVNYQLALWAQKNNILLLKMAGCYF